MTALSTAPVEEIQRRIGAKTVRVARLLLAAGWKHSVSIAERRDDFGAPEGWGILTHSWVRDLDVIEVFFNVSTEDVEIPAEFLSAHWRPAVDDSGVGFWNPGTIDRMPTEQIVDLLAVLGILPHHLSSFYQGGLADGRESVTAEVRACAEFGEGSHAFFDMAGTMPVLRDALAYWSSLATSTDTQAVIARNLEGLLDREPFVRREQAERVTETVFRALEADHG